MSTVEKHPRLAVELAAQADLILLVADLLRPPHQALPCHWPTRIELRQLVWASGLGPMTPLRCALWSAVRAASELAADQWQEQYSQMFEGNAACPLNQAAYVRRDKGKILGDLSGFVRAFGWAPRPDSGERLDHLVSTLEFTAALLAMASQAPDRTAADTTTEALEKFTRDHASDWLPSVCRQLTSTAPHELYRSVAGALAELWQGLRDYHQWPVDAQPGAAAAPAAEPEDPYECAAPDLVQLQPAAAKSS